MDPLRAGLKAQGAMNPGGGEGGGKGEGSIAPLGSAQCQAELDQAGANPATVLLVSKGPEGITAAECGLEATWRRGFWTQVSRGPHGEVDGEDCEFAGHI